MVRRRLPLHRLRDAGTALFTIGTLAAGTGITLSVPAQVLPNTVDGTVIALEAEVTDNTGAFVDGGTSFAVDSARGLELALEEDRDPVTPGGLLTYHLTYGLLENGPGAASVTLSLPLPAGTSFVSASDGGAESDGVVQWLLGGLDPGASGERQVTVAVDADLDPGSTLLAQSLLQDGAENTARYQATTRVQEPIGLVLVMTASPDPVQTGETMDVELTVTNTDALARTGVVLTLDFPDHIEQLFEVWFDGDCPSTACETQERGIFTIGTLAAGAGITYSVPAQVLPNTLDGTVIALEAEVTDNSGGFVDGGTSFAVADARVLDLAVTEFDPAVPGCTLTYSLTYGAFATGPGAPGATLEFRLPAQTTFESATNGGVLNGDVVAWDLGSLNPGSGGERRVTVAVGAGLVPGTILTGEARFTDRSLVQNEIRGDTATRVAAQSPLNVRVAISPEPAPPGQTLALLLSVTNTSGVTRSDVELLLEFPDHVAQLFESVFDGDCPSTACETQERAVFLVPTLVHRSDRELPRAAGHPGEHGGRHRRPVRRLCERQQRRAERRLRGVHGRNQLRRRRCGRRERRRTGQRRRPDPDHRELGSVQRRMPRLPGRPEPGRDRERVGSDRGDRELVRVTRATAEDEE